MDMEDLRKLYSAVKSEPDLYNGDLEYLYAMRDYYGCYLSWDMIACEVAGHTDVDSFNDIELVEFRKLFRRVVAQYALAESASYGRPN